MKITLKEFKQHVGNILKEEIEVYYIASLLHKVSKRVGEDPGVWEQLPEETKQKIEAILIDLSNQFAQKWGDGPSSNYSGLFGKELPSKEY